MNYGRDGHASDVRAILGSFNLHDTTEDGTVYSITKLVKDGTSQWVIGRNLTGFGGIRDLGESCVVIHNLIVLTDSLATLENDMLHYLSTLPFRTPDTFATLTGHGFTTH